MFSKYRHLLIPAAILASALALVAADLSGYFSPKSETSAGMAALNAGNTIKAIRNFSNAIKYCETDIHAHSLLGSAYQNYGWNDEALKEYWNTWRLAELNASNAMLNAARILAQRKDYEGASEAYRRFLLFNPESAQIWLELGKIKMAMGRQDEAKAAFSMALKYDTGAQQKPAAPEK